MSPKIVGVREKKDAVVYGTFELYPSTSPTKICLFQANVLGGPIPSAPIGITQAGGAWEVMTRTETNVCSQGPRGAYLPFDGSFVLLVVEGVVVKGRDEPKLSEILENVRLTVTVMQKPVWDGSMGQITVHDAVLDARIRQIEQVLTDLLQLEEGDSDTPAHRLRRGLRRLGWQPYRGVDNRCLARPVLVPERASVDIEVDVAPNLPIQDHLRLRVLLRGIATVHRL